MTELIYFKFSNFPVRLYKCNRVW